MEKRRDQREPYNRCMHYFITIWSDRDVSR